MCVYGIGLPFDHPIWDNLPPCKCSGGMLVEPYWLPPAWDNPPKVTPGPAWQPTYRFSDHSNPVMVEHVPARPKGKRRRGRRR